MADDTKNILNDLENIYFFSNVNIKRRPPISPVTKETRELARRSMDDFNKSIEKSKAKFAEGAESIELDGSNLSGVVSGDKWTIDKEGNRTRSYDKNEGLLEGILQRRTERVADPDKDVEFETLLDVLSYAQWAPNATNEQPTRVMIYKKDHSSMSKIGELMHKALYERMIPKINVRNYIINRKKENVNFLPDFSLEDLVKMDDEKFAEFKFEETPAPLHELPQTLDKLFERNKIVFVDGKYYLKNKEGKAGAEYSIKDLLMNDKVFTSGMGKFFLKFKNTHPYLIVVFRKWRYTSLMTETLNKYGIELPDVGEEYIDAGFYTDHLALATRGLGLSGVVKTGPMDLAKDELTELFIQDLEEKVTVYKGIIENEQSMPAEKVSMVKQEIKKVELLYQGLKYGLEAMRCKENNQPMREQLQTALKRGEVFVPATFFQLGHPLPVAEERVRDPRQGKNPLESMLVYMG